VESMWGRGWRDILESSVGYGASRLAYRVQCNVGKIFGQNNRHSRRWRRSLFSSPWKMKLPSRDAFPESAL
jgi:hypothetical protein